MKTNKKHQQTKSRKSWNNHLRIALLICVQSKNNTTSLASNYTVFFPNGSVTECGNVRTLQRAVFKY